MAVVASVKITLGTTPTGGTITTGSFTTANNSLLIVTLHSVSGASGFPTWTIAGGSLTWTKLVTQAVGGNFSHFVEIWTAPVTTGATMTVGATLSAGSTVIDGNNFSMDVVNITGHDTVGGWLGLTKGNSTTSSHSGAYSLTFTGTTASNSLVYAAASSDGDSGDPAPSGTAGYTAVHVFQGGTGGWFKSIDQYKIAAISTVDFGSWVTAYGHSAYAFEIKDATGGGPTGVTGTLGVTEAKDTAAITGTVLVSGTIGLTEAKDTAVITGTVASAGITGTLGVTEAKDTAVVSGTVFTDVTGTIGPTEAKDTAAISGGVLVSGTLGVTEAKDTALISGGVLVSGTLGATEAKDTADIDGIVGTVGGMGITIKWTDHGMALPTTSSGTFTPANNSLLIACITGLGKDTVPASYDVSSTGGLTWTRRARAPQTGTAVAVSEIWTAPVTTGTAIQITIAVADTQDGNIEINVTGYTVTNVTGYNVSSPIGLTATDFAEFTGGGIGALSVSLGGTTASDSAVFAALSVDISTGTTPIGVGSGYTQLLSVADGLSFRHSANTHEYKVGALSTYDFGSTSSSLTHASASIEVKAALPAVTGTLGVTEAKDTALISGSVVWTGTLGVTEAKDTALISGGIVGSGTLGVTEAKDTALISGGIVGTGTLGVTEAVDTAAISGTVVNFGTLGVTEAKDTAAFNGSVFTAGTITGTLLTTEATDTAVISGTVTGVAGTLAVTEAKDTAAVSGAVVNFGTLGTTEAKDIAGITGMVLSGVTGTLGVTEAKDTATITGNLALPGLSGTLGATEAPDVARIFGTGPVADPNFGQPGVLTFGRRVTINRW